MITSTSPSLCLFFLHPNISLNKHEFLRDEQLLRAEGEKKKWVTVFLSK